MNKWLCVVLMTIWAAIHGGACGQQTPPTTTSGSTGSNSLTLDVRVVANGGSQNDTKSHKSSNSNSGGNKIRERSVDLEVRARNLSTQPVEVKMQWFFLARSVADGCVRAFDTDSTFETIEPGKEFMKLLESKNILQFTTVTTEQKTVQFSRDHEEKFTTTKVDRSGARPCGWIVRIFAGGKVARVKASSTEFEKLSYNLADDAGPDALVSAPATRK